ncbi:hypothetical protein HF888_15405 [Bermanella marisrubri]|uniref:MSHA biogenesis protein MshJ n=1 Tax=Bermanella marisrubri TaxID=207949 RepID=Q1N2F9_9GAMM|nr:hypothetical protein [Bermanella marisrubri]EAT12448.1 hypothetical protein RED65_16461 [Oceanobacter sp. RED65] [Bermanella marisrubri]QIZ85527.1 hypothetical protein HF888_15405 [Bermanella marisrubri]
MTITFGCSLAFVLVLLFTLWIPKVETILGLHQQQERAVAQEAASKAAILELENRSKQDVNAPYRKQLKGLEIQVTEQERTIEDLTSSLILPNKMTQVFSELLDERYLKIIKLKNLEAKPIELDQKQTDSSVLFKHGLSLKLQGRYLNTMDYIKQIESQPWKLYWESLDFKMEKYPNGVLDLKVHSISTSDHVLGL